MEFNKNMILFFLSLIMAISMSMAQGTRIGFYARTCAQAESIVQSTVRKHFKADPTVAPGLLRMIFHDCFVQGCDASILIDGTSTEKTAAPNKFLRGYEVIDDAKAQLEAKCPGIVSCADITALAARDAVVLTGGIRWEVPTGRRDGRVSLASDTTSLPVFFDSVDVQKKKFAAKGLDIQDLVTLAGGHTIGTAACQFFSYRVYNFTSRGGADPSVDTKFVSTLKSLCPAKGNENRRVGLDYGSSNKFDISYFSNLQKGRGILESDQKLWIDASTKAVVQRLLGRGGLSFREEFGKAMVKLTNIGARQGL